MGKTTGATWAPKRRICPRPLRILERSSDMHRALLGLAASAAIAAISPAQGQSVTATGFSASSASEGLRSLLSGLSGRPQAGNFHHGFRHCDGQHCRRNHDGDGFGWAYSGYNDYGDYDANRSFDPDKWNDW